MGKERASLDKLRIAFYDEGKGGTQLSAVDSKIRTEGKGPMKKLCALTGLLVTLGIWGIVSPPSASGADWKAFSFPGVAGWKQSGEGEVFSPDTLFEYIDGGADIYLKYDFEELKVAEYQAEHQDKKATVTVEVYRHRTPNDAFGIYSQERLSGARFLQIGVQGYVEEDFLNFLAGPYYVKLSGIKIGPEEQDVLIIFAKKVAENLGVQGSFPSVLSSFPKEGKKENSETFIAKNFLGYPFLHSSFLFDYEVSGKKFRLFLIESTGREELKMMVQKYLRQIGKTGEDIQEGRQTLSDPHHGEVDLFWKGRFIWGVLDLGDASLRTKYLALFEEGLQNRK